MRRVALMIAVLLLPAMSVAQSGGRIDNEQETLQATTILLRGLDALNGTARDIPLRVGEVVRFGHLEIAVDACRVPKSDPDSDAYAFVRIRDIREETPRFSGWMFASSPALSALDHPRYDVWVESCSIN